jgi:hypothetical protein
MVQIPDSVRPYVIGIQRFHFWILAALTPLVLLPLVFLSRAGISQKIETQRSKIKGSLDSVTAILGKTPHPNEKWSEQIGARAREINSETLQVWEQLWKAQEPLRQWPESLGNDFVKAASSLAPDASLRRSLLERYQNGIRPVVRQLPGRMGADELMSDAASNEGMPAPRRQPVDRGQEENPPSLLQWSGEDQQQLFTSFDWEEPPSTTQVMMAQEELWMYGVLCDVIRNVNSVPVAADPKAVITPANIAIPLVQELKVGYPAAEDDPGGRASQRILRIQKGGGGGAGGGEMPFPEAMVGPEGAPAGRPAHPRFGGAGAAGLGIPMGMGPDGMEGGLGAEGGGSPDDALKNWVYVDLEGKPLSASELAAAPASQIFRLMPFVLRTTIDQRALDALLVELASAPVPIDTRQVRINAGESSGGDFGGRGPGRPQGAQSARFSLPSGDGSPGGDRARLHDVSVELRGTLAIVMRPDPSLIKVGDDGGQGEGSE